MRPWLCLSLPNSGSDWFADLVAQCTPEGRYYRKEFFNPITNWPHFGRLSQVFACELPSTAMNLHRQCRNMLDENDERRMLEVIDETWGQQDRWNCNKEVWSFANAKVLRQRFELWALTRSTDTLFPPSRARVWAWYDAIACAWDGKPSPATEIQDRCRMAHRDATDILLNSAKQFGFPVLDYDNLIHGNSYVVMDEIRKLCVTHSVVDGLDMQTLLRRVMLERREKSTTMDHSK